MTEKTSGYALLVAHHRVEPTMARRGSWLCGVYTRSAPDESAVALYALPADAAPVVVMDFKDGRACGGLAPTAPERPNLPLNTPFERGVRCGELRWRA
jgi:hypothetical protein